MWVKLLKRCRWGQNTWLLFQCMRDLASNHVLPCNVWDSCIKWKKKKRKDKKLTFTTLLSHKPWAASPLQRGDLLVGNLEGRPDHGPVAGGSSTLISEICVVATCRHTHTHECTDMIELQNINVWFLVFSVFGGHFCLFWQWTVVWGNDKILNWNVAFICTSLEYFHCMQHYTSYWSTYMWRDSVPYISVWKL